MATAKIAITLEESLLSRLDILVKSRIFPNRSTAIREAIQEKLCKIEGGRLAKECAKLSADVEQSFADEGMASELEEWPEY
ncbi:Ribbon-helix-helix protein CopG domain-containing protein [Candidatus Electronema halotolerans]